MIDAEAEGTLHLASPPTPDQAEAIRDALGIRRRVHLSPEVRDRRRIQLDKNRGFSAPQPQDALAAA